MTREEMEKKVLESFSDEVLAQILQTEEKTKVGSILKNIIFSFCKPNIVELRLSQAMEQMIKEGRPFGFFEDREPTDEECWKFFLETIRQGIKITEARRLLENRDNS